MAIPKAYLTAIFKYAPLVAPVAKQYGINGRQLLARLESGESGFNMGAVSSAGARGGAQFMPGTRADYLKRYGVDAWKNPDEATHAAALYLKSGGNLASYNPGMPSYTNYILGQHVGNLAKQLRGQGGSPSSLGSAFSNVTPSQSPASTQQSKVSQLMDIFAKMDQALPNVQQPGQEPNLGPTPQDFANNYKLISQLGSNVVSGPSGSVSPAGNSTPTSRLSSLGHGGAISTTYGGVTEHIKVGKLPPNVGPHNATKLNGLVEFDGKPVAAWIAAALQYARAQGWNGTISEGYRTKNQQAGIYNSGVRPAAKPGTSNHEFTAFPGGAVDVVGAQQLAQILDNSPYRGLLVWAGDKDPVHFSHPHNGGY